MSDCRFGVSPVNYPDPDPDPMSLMKVNPIRGQKQMNIYCACVRACACV